VDWYHGETSRRAQIELVRGVVTIFGPVGVSSMSETSQSPEAPVVSNVTPTGTHVLICDWHGIVRWISGEEVRLQSGDLAWKNLNEESRERAQQVFGRVVTLREEIVLEVENEQGHFFRVWLWPLDSPEMAVCVLSVAMPKALRLLSGREREALRLLAHGNSAKQIAQKLSVSLSTVHTYLRRSREKLGLDSTEALVGFAARFCQPCSVTQSILEGMPAAEETAEGETGEG
jgi:DNA-binding CsgD family transcriptional regulator